MTFRAFPRSEAPELLDADTLPLEHLAGNLQDIVRINRFLGGAAALMRAFTAVAEADFPDPNSPVTLIDVGTGAGDLPRTLAVWARDSRRPIRIWAVDIRAEALRIAQDAGERPANLGFAQADALRLPAGPGGVDYVIASLFLHHFNRTTVVALLRGFRACARKAVIINDLRRARLSYAAIYFLTRLATRNPMTRYDAPLSVQRGFRAEELEEIVQEAGFARWELFRFFPYRISLVARPEYE